MLKSPEDIDDGIRKRLIAELGPEGFVDAAAVLGNFERMNRIADATGIPLDGPVDFVTADLREDLGLNAFNQGARPDGYLKRLTSRMLYPLVARIMNKAG